MKFIHISDLHLGKKVYEYSMIEEQRAALKQVVEAVDVHSTDGVMIAGDIYDKSVPSTEAMELFDNFLIELTKRGQKVFVISGNHDSVERVSFGADIFKESGIYISRGYEGTTAKVTLKDEYGTVNIHLLPFVKPAVVRKYHENEDITDYNSAIRVVVDHMEIDENERNVILVHQFVTGAERSESEEQFLGGLDNVDYDVFDAFDYVALGHIHKPQSMGRKCVRYSGSPVKYSVDEIEQKKSMTIVEVKEKGNVSIETVPFKPVHDIRRIKGTYMELTDRNSYIDTDTDDYLHIILTDEQEIPDAYRRLKVIYRNILRFEYSNKRTAVSGSVMNMEQIKRKSYAEYVQELYEIQNNQAMSSEQMKLIERYWEESSGR